ncbi:unnamed protein product [Parajaminaea phylloscopi]
MSSSEEVLDTQETAPDRAPAGAEGSSVDAQETSAVNAEKQQELPGEGASTDQQQNGGQDGSDGEEEEEEYEIAKIHQHEPGVFAERPADEMAYFVSWVGYGSEHDSWVREEDAENAADMLSEYWRKQVPDKKVRKISKFADKVWVELEQERASKKRGRESQIRPSSRAANVKGKGKVKSGKFEDGEDSDDNVDVSRLGADEKEAYLKRRARRRYEKKGDWHDDVDSIDTVERNDEGRLIAYVKFKDGSRLAYDTAVVNHRCPQKIIALYESRLRWLPPTRGEEPIPSAVPQQLNGKSTLDSGRQSSEAQDATDGRQSGSLGTSAATAADPQTMSGTSDDTSSQGPTASGVTHAENSADGAASAQTTGSSADEAAGAVADGADGVANKTAESDKAAPDASRVLDTTADDEDATMAVL